MTVPPRPRRKRELDAGYYILAIIGAGIVLFVIVGLLTMYVLPPPQFFDRMR